MYFHNRKKEIFTVITCFIAVLITFVATAGADFQKTKIAVLDFELKGEGYETEDMGGIVAEWFTTALVKTGRFEVIERAMLNKIIEEQKLGLTGVVDSSSASQLGKILGVKTIISGSVLKLKNILEVNARIIDVESASIIAAENVKSSSSTSLQSLIERMASIIIKNFPLEGYVVNRTVDKITIDLGRMAGVHKDMDFAVYKEGRVIKHPKTGEVLDVEHIESGKIKIVKVRDKLSTGKIIEESKKGSIEYGQFVKSLAGKLSPPKPVETQPSGSLDHAAGSRTGGDSALIGKIRSRNPHDIRYAGKTVYRDGSRNPAVYDAIEEELLDQYNDRAFSDLQVDALAWLCKALGRSGEAKYKKTLEKVSREAPNEKLRKYASESVVMLGQKGEENILIRKIHSQSSSEKRYAGKIIYRQGSRDPAVYDAIEEELLDQYKKSPDDNLHIDALSWLCKALGRSGNSKYRKTLEKISQDAPNGKLRKYARKSLNYL